MSLLSRLTRLTRPTRLTRLTRLTRPTRHSAPPPDPLLTATDSRTATDLLLGSLREGGLDASAWAVFLRRATERSVVQALRRPLALAQVTGLHTAVLVLTRGRGWRWTTFSWAMAASHLGLLERRDRLSAADWLTLTRAQLPTLAPDQSRWLGLVAIATDLADGLLARRQETVTPYGAYADHLADAAFWTWLVWRHEQDRRLRAAAIAVWAAPVVTVTTLSAARGRMVEPPSPALLRPAAAMQAAVAVRRLTDRPRRTR